MKRPEKGVNHIDWWIPLNIMTGTRIFSSVVKKDKGSLALSWSKRIVDLWLSELQGNKLSLSSNLQWLLQKATVVCQGRDYPCLQQWYAYQSRSFLWWHYLKKKVNEEFLSHSFISQNWYIVVFILQSGL